MMNNKKEKFARFGIATKGFIYILIGVLTALTAFGTGGKKTGSSGAIEYLSQQTFGRVLLVITALGLVGYVFWRFYQAITDLENKGNDFKGIIVRLGYAISGIFYGILAFFSLNTVFGSSASSSEDNKESVISTLLEQPFGQIMVGILGVIFLGKAVYQFYMAYSDKYKKKVEESPLDSKAKDLLIKTGVIGFTARGLVISVISFFIFQAAFTANSNKVGGTKQALHFIQNEFGAVVLILIALGLAAYGVFMLVRAKYAQITLN